MATERIRRKRHRWKYHIVLLPQGEAGKSLSFRMGILAAVVVLILYSVAVGAITIVLLKWTHLGVWIPVKNPELERRYGKQVTALQSQLNRVVSEVEVMQHFNSKLREALGLEMRPAETQPSVIAQAGTRQSEETSASLTAGQKTTEKETGSDETVGGVPISPPDAHMTLGYAPSSVPSARSILPLQLPASGYITRGFDPTRGHYGIDIAGRRGSPIVAAADGYILFAGWTYDAGYMMIIAHSGGYFTFYKHNQSLLKTANTFVRRGEPIALLGNTGALSHGPHLHFEVWKDGIPRDPSEYVLNFHLF